MIENVEPTSTMTVMLLALRLSSKLDRVRRAWPASRAVPRQGPARATGVAVALVAGVFAMHGMGDYGVHSGDHPESGRTEAVAASGAGGDRGSVPQAADRNGLGDGTTPASRSLLRMAVSVPDPVSGGGVLGLCLTLLTAALVLWWLRLASREAASVLAAPASVRTGGVGPARARAPTPPRRSQLCICRC